MGKHGFKNGDHAWQEAGFRKMLAATYPAATVKKNPDMRGLPDFTVEIDRITRFTVEFQVDTRPETPWVPFERYQQDPSGADVDGKLAHFRERPMDVWVFADKVNPERPTTARGLWLHGPTVLRLYWAGELPVAHELKNGRLELVHRVDALALPRTRLMELDWKRLDKIKWVDTTTKGGTE